MDLVKILANHQLWLVGGDGGGTRADLSGADLEGINLREADLREADLEGINLMNANLYNARLNGSDLEGADLREADLRGANLMYANLMNANLMNANILCAHLNDADLTNAKGLIKHMDFEPGNFYWKRFGKGLTNGGYQFYVGLNSLREGEVFAGDERVSCSYPGFHFASRTLCNKFYRHRPLEARIRIPSEAQINEPWASDGQASASAIEILQVFDVETGEDVTEEYRRTE